MSYKVEVKTVNDSTWTGNGLYFETYSLADNYGFDLSCRWFAVEEYRVVESDQPVNRFSCDYIEGGKHV